MASSSVSSITRSQRNRAGGRRDMPRRCDRRSPHGRCADPRGWPAGCPGADMSNTTIGIVVVTAERDRRGVHHLEVLGHHVHVADLVVLRGVGVEAGVGVVDPVDSGVGALDQDLGVDLGGAQRRRGVGGEERVAGAGGEDHDAALLEVAHGPPADVRLGDARHLDRRLHPGRLAEALEGVLQGEGVHHRAEHADVVGLGGVHALHRARAAAPEVAAADHHGDVDVEVLAQVDDRRVRSRRAWRPSMPDARPGRRAPHRTA